MWSSVQLVEGDKPGDTRVVFRITEGRVVKVTGVKFVGNTFVSGERLRTQITTSRSIVANTRGRPMSASVFPSRSFASGTPDPLFAS